VRRRLEPVERALPLKLPGYEAAGTGDFPARADEPPARAEGAAPDDDAAARIDAARERLRATIEPPADPDS
jgi:hypothetical protein